jgi:hypothetical protein
MSAIDSHVQAEQCGDEDDDGQAGALAPRGLIARRWNGRSITVWKRELVALGTPVLTCTNLAGAGDENRTRTISLGSAAVTPAKGADQAYLAVLSDRG